MSAPNSSIIDDAKIKDFQSVIIKWINELYINGTSSSGYISKDDNKYTKKIRELVKFTLSKSPEISAIRMQRSMYTRTPYKIIRSFMYFMFEHIIPLIFVYYLINNMYFYLINQPLEEKIIVQGKPETYFEYGFSKVSNFVGVVVGTSVHQITKIVSIILDNTFGVNHLVSKMNSGVVSVIIGLIVWRCLIPISSIINQYKVRSEKSDYLIILQSEFMNELEDSIERSIMSIVRPVLMEQFEKLLYITNINSNDENKNAAMEIINVFSSDYNVLYVYIFVPLEEKIRGMELSEIMRSSPMSSNFIETLFQLVRHSGDDLAQHLNRLNRSLMEMPYAMRESVVSPVRNFTSQMTALGTQIGTEYMRRNLLT